jgi:hypothetical protein
VRGVGGDVEDGDAIHCRYGVSNGFDDALVTTFRKVWNTLNQFHGEKDGRWLIRDERKLLTA